MFDVVQHPMFNRFCAPYIPLDAHPRRDTKMPGSSNIPRKKGYIVTDGGKSYVEVVTVRRYTLGPRDPSSPSLKDRTAVSYRLKKMNRYDGPPKAVDVREIHVGPPQCLAQGL